MYVLFDGETGFAGIILCADNTFCSILKIYGHFRISNSYNSAFQNVADFDISHGRINLAGIICHCLNRSFCSGSLRSSFYRGFCSCDLLNCFIGHIHLVHLPSPYYFS